MKKILFMLIPLFTAAPAFAYTNQGVEEQPLFFGQLVITDNTSARSCTIPAGGAQTCDAELIILDPGQYGVFILSDFDPSVAIWASINNGTMTGAGGAVFDVQDFTFNPDIHDIGTARTPDPDGTLELKIGATLKTRAGVSYNMTTYRGTFTLQINY